jgi:hypothetical protein
MDKDNKRTKSNNTDKKLHISDVIHMLPTDEEINDQKYVGRSPAHCEEWEGFQQGVKWVIDYIKDNCV